MRKSILIALSVAAVALFAASEAHAWGAAHMGYTHVGYGGVQHVGYTAARGPYGAAGGVHYGATGYGGAHYGTTSTMHYGYGGAGAYSGYHVYTPTYGGGAAVGGYHYSTPYGYSAGVYRRY